MTTTTIKVVRLDKPGNSLAAWIAGHHPDIFVALVKKAQAAQAAKGLRGLRGLAQDGVTTTFDTGTTTLFDTSAVSAPDVTLEPVTVDTSSLESLPTNILTDSNTSGSSWLDSVGSGLTSAGSTLSSAVGNILGAVGSVGSYLTSKSGLDAVTSLGKAYFTAQGQTAQAQTQQQVLQTQINRVATGGTAAPITYTKNSAGQLVPVYQTQTAQGSIFQPLTSAGIASLSPSSLSVLFANYGVWILLGGAALVFAMARKG